MVGIPDGHDGHPGFLRFFVESLDQRRGDEIAADEGLMKVFQLLFVKIGVLQQGFVHDGDPDQDRFAAVGEDRQCLLGPEFGEKLDRAAIAKEIQNPHCQTKAMEHREGGLLRCHRRWSGRF